jgi:uncharacterized protein
MRIHVAYVAPDLELCVAIDVADGATVDDAVRASGIARRIGMVPDSRAFAIFGKRVSGDSRVAPGDRIEITRPLVCDPQAARRTRAALASPRAAASSRNEETVGRSTHAPTDTPCKGHPKD